MIFDHFGDFSKIVIFDPSGIWSKKIGLFLTLQPRFSRIWPFFTRELKIPKSALFLPHNIAKTIFSGFWTFLRFFKFFYFFGPMYPGRGMSGLKVGGGVYVDENDK